VCLECSLATNADRECSAAAASHNSSTAQRPSPEAAQEEEEHNSVDFCYACFASGAVAHVGKDKDGITVHANKWLCVSSEGEHTVEKRQVAVGVAVREVVAADLTHHAYHVAYLDDDSANLHADCCPVCMCEFEADDPPCSPPGCTQREHGWHADCVLQFLKATNKHVYFVSDGGGDEGGSGESSGESGGGSSKALLPPKTYFCQQCREASFKEAEVAAILAELDGILASFSAATSAAGCGGGSNNGGASLDLKAVAAAALAGAPSLAGRELLMAAEGFKEEEPPPDTQTMARADDNQQQQQGGAVLRWVVRWAAAELKKVHAVRGTVNAHLHEALDKRVEELS
jgi:hypothetical protein